MNNIIKFALIFFSLILISACSPRALDEYGWSNKCKIFSDCAFIEKVNVPVPGSEGCFSIKDNPVIQDYSLSSGRKDCECVNNFCRVKEK